MNPWQAAIIRKYDLGRRPFCGGSLISDRHVLTAGHCTFELEDYPCSCSVLCTLEIEFEPAELIVRLGAFDWTDQRETSAQNYRVENIILHEGYMGNGQHDHDDIALLVLRKDVPFGAHIDKIRLPQRGDDYPGQMARMTGWGLLMANGTKPKQLQSVKVRIFDHDLKLRGDELKPARRAENEIYAGRERGGKGFCKGDSGGPLSVENERTEGRRVLVGVAVRSKYGKASSPLGTYMRVTYYLPWIEKSMESIYG